MCNIFPTQEWLHSPLTLRSQGLASRDSRISKPIDIRRIRIFILAPNLYHYIYQGIRVKAKAPAWLLFSTFLGLHLFQKTIFHFLKNKIFKTKKFPRLIFSKPQSSELAGTFLVLLVVLITFRYCELVSCSLFIMFDVCCKRISLYADAPVFQGLTPAFPRILKPIDIRRNRIKLGKDFKNIFYLLLRGTDSTVICKSDNYFLFEGEIGDCKICLSLYLTVTLSAW